MTVWLLIMVSVSLTGYGQTSVAIPGGVGPFGYPTMIGVPSPIASVAIYQTEAECESAKVEAKARNAAGDNLRSGLFVFCKEAP